MVIIYHDLVNITRKIDIYRRFGKNKLIYILIWLNLPSRALYITNCSR